MLESLQNWSKSLKFLQGVFLVAIGIYMILFSGGGFFTAYYAWLLAIVGGLIATIASLFQRNVVMMGIDVFLMGLMFLHFLKMA